MPDFKEEIRKRLVALNLAPTRENEIVEELSQHLEDHYEQSLRTGVSGDEAYDAALNELRASDLSGPLKQIERRVQQEPVVIGRDGNANLLGVPCEVLRYADRSLRMRRGSAA